MLLLVSVLCLFCLVPLGSSQTTPVAIPDDERCPCNVPGIWLDIIVLFESSKAMTFGGMIEAAAFVATALQPVNIGQATDAPVTRVGVITYSDNATVYAQLDRYTNTSFFVNDLVQNVPFDDRDGTNIQAAIQAASAEFASARHRFNAQKVIIIVGSDYDAGGSQSPIVAADQFKSSGGIIVTICYVQNAGAANEMLRNLATPGFALDSKTDDLSTPRPVHDLLCQGNCYCRPTYGHYTTASGEKTNVCVFSAELSSSQAIAGPTCIRSSSTGKGILVREETGDKRLFVSTFARNSLNSTGGQLAYWNDLKRNGSVFTWANGVQPDFSGDWASGEPSANGDCVRTVQQSGFQVGWVVTDCTTSSFYLCQEPTCDTENYCTWENKDEVGLQSEESLSRARRFS